MSINTLFRRAHVISPLLEINSVVSAEVHRKYELALRRYIVH